MPHSGDILSPKNLQLKFKQPLSPDSCESCRKKNSYVFSIIFKRILNDEAIVYGSPFIPVRLK